MYRALCPGAVNLNVSFPEAAALASKYGYGALEVDPLHLEREYGLSRAQDILAQNGVVPCCFGLPVTVQKDIAAFNESFPKLERAARAASGLGIHRCSTYIFSWSDALPFAENFRAHTKMLRACAEVLRDYGICLGLEFLGPQTLYTGKAHEFIHTLDGMLELCDAVGTGNMGILLDAYHAYAAGMDESNCLGAFKSESQISLVHINDAPKDAPIETLPDTLRYLPGEGGGIDIKGFLQSLKAFGYTGPVITEPFSQTLKALSDPDQIMATLKAAEDSVWVD